MYIILISFLEIINNDEFECDNTNIDADTGIGVVFDYIGLFSEIDDKK